MFLTRSLTFLSKDGEELELTFNHDDLPVASRKELHSSKLEESESLLDKTVMHKPMALDSQRNESLVSSSMASAGLAFELAETRDEPLAQAETEQSDLEKSERVPFESPVLEPATILVAESEISADNASEQLELGATLGLESNAKIESLVQNLSMDSDATREIDIGAVGTLLIANQNEISKVNSVRANLEPSDISGTLLGNQPSEEIESSLAQHLEIGSLPTNTNLRVSSKNSPQGEMQAESLEAQNAVHAQMFSAPEPTTFPKGNPHANEKNLELYSSVKNSLQAREITGSPDAIPPMSEFGASSSHQESTILKAIAHAKAEQIKKRESAEREAQKKLTRSKLLALLFGKVFPVALVIGTIFLAYSFRKEIGVGDVLLAFGVSETDLVKYDFIEKNSLLNDSAFVKKVENKIAKQKLKVEKKKKLDAKKMSLAAKSLNGSLQESSESKASQLSGLAAINSTEPLYEQPENLKDVPLVGEAFLNADEALVLGDASAVVAAFSAIHAKNEKQEKTSDFKTAFEKSLAVRFAIQTRNYSMGENLLNAECNRGRIELTSACLHFIRIKLETKKFTEAKNIASSLLKLKNLTAPQKLMIEMSELARVMLQNPSVTLVSNYYSFLQKEQVANLNAEWLRQYAFWGLSGLFSLNYREFYEASVGIVKPNRAAWSKLFNSTQGSAARSEAPLLQKTFQVMFAVAGVEPLESFNEATETLSRFDHQLSRFLDVYSKSQISNPKNLVEYAQGLKRKPSFSDASRLLAGNLHIMSGNLEEGAQQLKYSRTLQKEWVKSEEVIGLTLAATMSGKQELVVRQLAGLRKILVSESYKKEFMAWYLYARSLGIVGKKNTKSLEYAKLLAVDSRQKGLVLVEECESLKFQKRKQDAFTCAKEGLKTFPANTDLAQLASELAGTFGENTQEFLQRASDAQGMSSKFTSEFFPLSYTAMQKIVLQESEGT